MGTDKSFLYDIIKSLYIQLLQAEKFIQST